MLGFCVCVCVFLSFKYPNYSLGVGVERLVDKAASGRHVHPVRVVTTRCRMAVVRNEHDILGRVLVAIELS